MKIVKNLGILFLGALLGSLVLQVTDLFGQAKTKAKIGYVDMDALLAQHPKRAEYEKILQEFIRTRQEDIQSKSSLPGLTEEQKKKLQALQQQYEKEIMEKDKELTENIVDDVIKKVKIVAEENNMELVFQKSAVLYGGVDITQEVLKTYKLK